MTLAIIFDSVGAGEWLVLLAVLLVVMGPKRLPSTARKIGSYYSKFRRAADSFKRQLMDMDLEMEREMRKAEQEAEDAVKIPDVTEAEAVSDASASDAAGSVDSAAGEDAPAAATGEASASADDGSSPDDADPDYSEDGSDETYHGD